MGRLARGTGRGTRNLLLIIFVVGVLAVLINAARGRRPVIILPTEMAVEAPALVLKFQVVLLMPCCSPNHEYRIRGFKKV